MAPRKRLMTDKQARFVEEYLVDCCAADAARRAGYSAHTAEVRSFQLLKMPHIQEAIAEKRKVLAVKAEVSAGRVLQEYCRIAFVDVRKIFNADGSLKPVHEMDDDTAAAVASVEVEQTNSETKRGVKTAATTVKTKMLDKIRALDALAKHLGLFKDADVTQLVQQTQYKVYIGFDPREV